MLSAEHQAGEFSACSACPGIAVAGCCVGPLKRSAKESRMAADFSAANSLCTIAEALCTFHFLQPGAP